MSDHDDDLISGDDLLRMFGCGEVVRNILREHRLDRKKRETLYRLSAVQTAVRIHRDELREREQKRERITLWQVVDGDDKAMCTTMSEDEAKGFLQGYSVVERLPAKIVRREATLL